MAKLATPRREAIMALIKTGNMTKAEIATELGMKESGVSSQLTYLRWMGNFIMWDEDKKLSFCTEEEYNAWTEAKSAKSGKAKRASVSKKTPAEQKAALTKTVANQEKTLAKWQDKVSLLSAEDEVDKDALAEAQAQSTLFGLKLKKNTEKLAAFDDVEEDEVEVDEIDDSDEELL